MQSLACAHLYNKMLRGLFSPKLVDPSIISCPWYDPWSEGRIINFPMSFAPPYCTYLLGLERRRLQGSSPTSLRPCREVREAGAGLCSGGPGASSRVPVGARAMVQATKEVVDSPLWREARYFMNSALSSPHTNPTPDCSNLCYLPGAPRLPSCSHPVPVSVSA